MRRAAAAVGLALAALAACGGESSAGTDFGLVRVASGLVEPVHVAAPSSEPRRLYVVERRGRIRVLVDGKLRSRPFLDISGLVQSGYVEQGLLSIAFHPDYARNRRFYVDYTDRRGHTRVVEFRSDGRAAVPSSARQLLFVRQPYANHNGGQLAFGPDGYLYVGMGDGGGGGDPANRAQDLRQRLGKLLRLNVDRRGAKWQIVGYGLRNPWRFSFDRANGDLYVGDVGQGEVEEVDYTPRSSPGLENYGWDVFEGSRRFEDKSPNPRGRLVGPVAEYDHGQGCSIVGGFVYRGQAVPAAQGRYFYGDSCSGKVWSLRIEGGKATDVREERLGVSGAQGYGLVSFGEDARGELYLVSFDGTIYRLAG